MLGKLGSRGSKGFTSGLLVANLHLRGIAKGRDATAPISSSRPFLYSLRSEQGYAQFPRRVLLGNLAYLTREEGCLAVAKARRESGSTTNTMMKSATTSSTALRTRTPTVAPTTTPGAPARRLSTQTMMVAQKLHAFIIHNPAATTRPTMPSTKAV